MLRYQIFADGNFWSETDGQKDLEKEAKEALEDGCHEVEVFMKCGTYTLPEPSPVWEPAKWHADEETRKQLEFAHKLRLAAEL